MADTTERNNPNDYYHDVSLDSAEVQDQIAECKVCFSLVLNRADHLRWHKKLNVNLKKAISDSKKSNDWDWPPMEEDSEHEEESS